MNARQYLSVIAALWVVNVAIKAQDVMPLKPLDLGQTSQQMFSTYPEAKVIFEKRDRGLLIDGVVALPVTNNLYWSGAIIRIIDDRIASIGYAQAASFERGFSNTPIILRHLIRLEGTNFVRAVARHHSKAGKVESPVLLWEKPDRVLAYSFMPLEAYKEGEPFVCQLTVFPRGKKREEFFEMATLPEVETARVFKSVEEILQKEGAPGPR